MSDPTPPEPKPPTEAGAAEAPNGGPIPAPPPHLVSVSTAASFATVSFGDAMAAALAVAVGRIRDWLADPASARGLLFDAHRDECPEVAIVRDPAAVPANLWVVGDVHADVLALANIVAHADRVATAQEPPAFVFLGDFVDRGRHDHEALLLLFGLILERPGRVCVIPGNHDIDLQWGPKARRFGVTIEPAEYCERLNRLLASDAAGGHDEVELARLLIPFWQGRPKAVILPDGTLLAHGGFPHTDTHAGLRTPADLGSRACVSDFLWARVAEGRRKRPNRGNRGHEFGWDDFAQFCRKSAEIGVPAVKRLVRGHDHVPDRWQFVAGYEEYPVLTLNAMGRWLDGELRVGDRPPLPVMARHVPHQLPDVVRLPLDPTEVAKAFPPEGSLPGARPSRPPAAGTAALPAGDPEPADDVVFGGPRVDPPQPAPEPGPGGGR